MLNMLLLAKKNASVGWLASLKSARLHSSPFGWYDSQTCVLSFLSENAVMSEQGDDDPALLNHREVLSVALF